MTVFDDLPGLDHLATAAQAAEVVSDHVGDDLLLCVGNSPLEAAMAAKYMRKIEGRSPLRLFAFPYSKTNFGYLNEENLALRDSTIKGRDAAFDRLFAWLDDPEHKNKKIVVLDYAVSADTLNGFVRVLVEKYAAKKGLENEVAVQRLVDRLDVCAFYRQKNAGDVPQVCVDFSVGDKVVRVEKDIRVLQGVPGMYLRRLEQRDVGRFMPKYTAEMDHLPLAVVFAYGSAETEEERARAVAFWALDVKKPLASDAKEESFVKKYHQLVKKDPEKWAAYLDGLKEAVRKHVARKKAAVIEPQAPKPRPVAMPEKSASLT